MVENKNQYQKHQVWSIYVNISFIAGSILSQLLICPYINWQRCLDNRDRDFDNP